MYQVCPICKGTGKAGHSWPNSPVCDVCNGQKIISSLTGMPPNPNAPETQWKQMPVQIQNH